MAQPAKNDSRGFSYADYLSWTDEKERWELIDGQAFDMSLSPSRVHQDILRNLSIKLGNFLKGKECKMYFAPFDVRLPDFQDDTDELTYTVVQPDISVICDLKKPDEKGCVGAPDLIIEILSPSTVGKDVKIKLSLYENKVFTET